MRIIRPGMVVGPQQQYMLLNQMKWVTWVSQLCRINPAKADGRRRWIKLPSSPKTWCRIVDLETHWRHLHRRLISLYRLPPHAETSMQPTISSSSSSVPSCRQKLQAICGLAGVARLCVVILCRTKVAMLLTSREKAEQCLPEASHTPKRQSKRNLSRSASTLLSPSRTSLPQLA
jgi:hypothetical protein